MTAARGRAQSLQTIPMAVSAIQASTLSTKGIDNIADIVKSVPSVNIVERGPGQSQVTIRGISSGAFSITETGDRPLVSIYLDDVPISIQGANPDLKVFDLERVEVLRGPQGTLYGSGSMAGTIRYITIKPSTDRFSGSAEGVLSGTSHAGNPNWNIRGSINAPLGESLALLASAYTGRDAGWIDNLGTGKKDANTVRTTQARGALRWTGVSDLTVDASLLYTRLKTGGLPVGYSTLTRYQYDSLSPETFRDRMLVGNLTIDLAVGGGHLTNSASYVDRDFKSITGGFSYEYLNDFIFGGVRTASPASVVQNVQTFTNELRYVSDPSLPFTYSFGGFYEHTTRDYEQNNPLAGLDAAVGLPSVPSFGTPFADDLFYGTQHIKERQYALFGEANYKFSEAFDVTAGVRYFNFRQSFNLAFTGLAGSAFEANPSGSPTFLPLTQSGKPKADGFNPRFVASYHADKDAMIFAEVSKGFRYGSVNEPVAPAFCNGSQGPTTVGADSLWNYAMGLKSQFADRRVTFNVTGFFVDWNTPQTRVDLSCGYYYRINAGKIESKGIELETAFRPFDGLTIALNGSYTDAKAKQGVAVVGADPIVASGDRAPLFPRWLGSLSTQYEFPLGEGEMTLSGDVQYRGSFYNRFSPLNVNYRETPAQTLLNASISYSTGNYEVGLFGTNLGNSRNLALVDSVRDRPGTITAPDAALFYGKPRTIGVRGKVKF
ncbi:MAG: TonB-dependent receptor [Sphingopyxis sp.]|nr:TonB-dependent receptor [Sphingopyxis sp.]